MLTDHSHKVTFKVEEKKKRGKQISILLLILSREPSDHSMTKLDVRSNLVLLIFSDDTLRLKTSL